LIELRHFALVLALALPTALRGARPESLDVSEDWSKSPEAYFLTSEEKQEWQRLKSRESRSDFIERYWLKRDPTPGTEKNEFRDVVLGRIKTAEKRFGIQKTPGSRTARGLVFIVLGSPARAVDSQSPRPEAPRSPQPGGPPRNPVGLVEGTETTSTWLYDRERTPRLLEALGKPSLEITIVLEPNRRHDEIQNPGLFNEYWETLARKSIVNPDLVPPPTEAQPVPPREVLPRIPLSAQTRSLLQKAPLSSRGENGAVFGSAVLQGTSAYAKAIVWFFLPQEVSDRAGKLTFHALVQRRESGSDVMTLSEPASLSKHFSSVGRGDVVSKSFWLPPGEYQAFFAVEGADGRLLASAATSLHLPESQERFAVSSLLLAAGSGPVEPGADALFALGKAYVPPRADARFSRSESLWYFLEIARPADPTKVSHELRLRRGGDVVASNAWASAELSETAPGRHVLGFEIPLKNLTPGDYSLYVTVRDGEAVGAPHVVRRGDFRLAEGGTEER
jgi:GWxTD domain-containing protein